MTQSIRRLAGQDVPAIGLGLMGMSEFYGAHDDGESLATLHAAFELGVRHLDTADTYGAGHNEQLLGRFVAELKPAQRAELLIATKFGINRPPGSHAGPQGRRIAASSPPRGSKEAWDGPALPYERHIDNSPAYIRAACEDSLKRLGVEQLGLYYVHRRDPARPIEAVMDSLVALKAEGKIAAIGLSEVSAQTLRRAHAVHPVAALQSEYSLWERAAEQEMLPTCAALGVAFVAYSPLGRALLSATMPATQDLAPDDFRRMLPRFNGAAGAHNRALVARLAELAAAWGMPPSQLALAWILNKHPHVLVIPGTRRQTHLGSNWSAGQIALNAVQVAALDALFAAGAVAGERYTEGGWVGIESVRS
ncbi:aldo/keto reductase [Roseateles albus]|uniref:Aldo/keto reductase n=1 Tax=Roseateles albus TaxID=2987525 RepID=A0ABT5K9F3_9BURK|nr:aldo/keto reductase [Roseateles albus]MDC8770209.1 aldo/keto reductase [Roseateles albus]